MKTTAEINKFDFFINFQTNSAIKVENKLLLIDNLDEEDGVNRFINSQHHKEMIKHDIPIKFNLAMVLFCKKGEMRLQMNLKDITVKENCILAIMPGSVGRLCYLSDDFISAGMVFSSSNYQPNIDIHHIIKSQHLVFNYPVIQIKEKRMAEFLNIYQTMHSKLSDNEFNRKMELADAYLQVIKIYWEDCNEQLAIDINPQKRSRQKVIFDSFLNEIVKHYKDNRSVAFYADKLFISPKYLSKVIKDVSNKQPSDWIRELVILEAKALLRAQQHTVQQISEELNFTSPSFFGRYFRETVGCTPKEYQNEV
nr:helix-turn-helix domain-containing protein [uncultured Carboxylicivirga sp.]